MQPEFWSERWRTGQIGFHQAQADKHLTRHWREINLAQGSRVFVPLCGKSLDLLWLRDHGHPVVGVELSAIALEAFCMENGVPARRRTRRDFRATPDFDVATSDFDLATSDFEVYEAPNLELFCGDYFALTQAQLGDLAAVFDRAA